MATENPTCCGCYINWSTIFQIPMPDMPCAIHTEIKIPYFKVETSVLLTEEEKKILYLLVEAWQDFVQLDKKHEDDDNDFRRAIHDAQKIIALRVVRRLEPNVWKQPE